MKPDANLLTRRRALKTGFIGSATALGLTGIGTANGPGKGKGGGGGPGNVDIEFSKGANSSGGNGIYVGASPTVAFSKKIKVVPATNFDIENKRTGDTLTVSVDSNQVPDAIGVFLDINKYDGTLKPPSVEYSGIIAISRNGIVNLDYTVSGDTSTFVDSAGVPYDEFQVTMGIGGSEIDATSYHLVPIHHRIGWSDEIIDNGDRYRFSFNANGLPNDAGLHVVIVGSEGGRVKVPPNGVLFHNPGPDRYVGEIGVDQLPSEPIDVLRMTVSDSTTGFRIISLSNRDFSIDS